jgi:hypothetical protein
MGVAVVMIVSILSGLSFLATQSAVPARPVTPAPVAEEKPVCRREAPVGSNLTVRVCHTKADWRTIDATNGESATTVLSERRMARPYER